MLSLLKRRQRLKGNLLYKDALTFLHNSSLQQQQQQQEQITFLKQCPPELNDLGRSLRFALTGSGLHTWRLLANCVVDVECLFGFAI